MPGEPAGDEKRECEFGRVLIRPTANGKVEANAARADYVVEVRGDGMWRGPLDQGPVLTKRHGLKSKRFFALLCFGAWIETWSSI
jgi:hypothetical protein